jgi:putative nucleotidyltransferase with HDIG domain
MPADAARNELILRQIDTLPTLPAVALRLLELTADEDATASQVVQLVSADPALTAKLISMCRSAERGVSRDQPLDVERAVKLLGFETIRSTVLSLKLSDHFQPREAKTSDDSRPGLDRPGLWTHSLAVAVAAESLARAAGRSGVKPEVAFTAGLLHDIGKLALDQVLPRAYRQVLTLARQSPRDLAAHEQQVLGLDHHTAGRRVAERWGLPHALQDVVWLHGSPPDALPQVAHRPLILVVSLADQLARSLHLGDSANPAQPSTIDGLADRLGLTAEQVATVRQTLVQQLHDRGEALGLDPAPSEQMLLEAVHRANTALARMTRQMTHRSRDAATHAALLEAIGKFHQADAPGRGVQDTLDRVAESARQVLGDRYLALVCPAGGPTATPTEDGEPAQRAWLICEYPADGDPSRCQLLEPPADAALPDVPEDTIHAGDATADTVGGLTRVMPWLTGCVLDPPDPRGLRVAVLPCGWGAAAVLIAQPPGPGESVRVPWDRLGPMRGAWGAAVASASQHEGARRLSEDLARANRDLADAQDRVAETASLARLGEMAAGAAHEMNNPLAVIAGRSQLLSMSLPANSTEQKYARQVFDQAHRLSDLITALSLFADPPKPKPEPTDVPGLLDELVRRTRAARSRRNQGVDVTMAVHGRIGSLLLDRDHLRDALTALLDNALQATPRAAITLHAQLERGDASGRMLQLRIVDDGQGMDAHTLHHATDPFFSAKGAGRRVGMGLPRAVKLIEASGGRLSISSVEGEGTTVTLWLPAAAVTSDDEAESPTQAGAAA